MFLLVSPEAQTSQLQTMIPTYAPYLPTSLQQKLPSSDVLFFFGFLEADAHLQIYPAELADLRELMGSSQDGHVLELRFRV